MMKTRETQLTKKFLLKLTLINMVKRIFILIVFFVALVNVFDVFLFGLEDFKENFWLTEQINFTLIPILIILMIVENLVRIGLFFYSKKNEKFYLKKTYTFDQDFLYTHVQDGSESKMNWNNIDKVKKMKNYYTVYISKRSFIYIPFDIFENSQDQLEFEKLLHEKKLLK